MTRTTDRTIRALSLCAALLMAALPLAVRAQSESLPGLEGGRLTQAELAEGDTIIVVWASWSPRSRALGERMAAISERWGKSARVITVNFQEEPETARAFAKRQKLQVPVYLDKDAVFAKRFAVTSLPFLIVLDDGETDFAGKLPADADAVIERSLD